MPKTRASGADVLRLIFHKTPLPAEYGDDFFVSLHSKLPRTPTDSELAYTGYKRATTTRTTVDWREVTGKVARVENAGVVSFPVCKSVDGGHAGYFGISTQAEGDGRLVYRGALLAPLDVVRNMAPEFLPGALANTEE